MFLFAGKPVTTSPTFPPPFPNGGFPQPGGGFPQPGGGFPRPGGGFPQPGGGFPRPGGGFPRPGGGFPRPGGGFPRPGAGDEVAPSFGDEKIVENIAGMILFHSRASFEANDIYFFAPLVLCIDRYFSKRLKQIHILCKRDFSANY